MNPSGMAAGLGLLSAASWGGSDFVGGLGARRSPALLVVASGHFIKMLCHPERSVPQRSRRTCFWCAQDRPATLSQFSKPRRLGPRRTKARAEAQALRITLSLPLRPIRDLHVLQVRNLIGSSATGYLAALSSASARSKPQVEEAEGAHSAAPPEEAAVAVAAVDR
jgi:hypothetical protein